MALYDIGALQDDFVIHYGVQRPEINAVTFTESLDALHSALQIVNRYINPDYELEISISALGPGSFRSRLVAGAKTLSPLISKPLNQIIVGVLVSIITSKCLGPDATTVINIETVIIQSDGGANVIVIPKEVFEVAQKLQSDPELENAIRKTFQAVEDDPKITSFGFAADMEQPTDQMPVTIDREQFASLTRPSILPTLGHRQITEIDVKLRVIRAILEDNNRLWQFIWRGTKISAPVLDKDFRSRLLRRDIKFAHGDVMTVDLRITQELNDDEIWENVSYEVVSVKAHEPATGQGSLF